MATIGLDVGDVFFLLVVQRYIRHGAAHLNTVSSFAHRVAVEIQAP